MNILLDTQVFVWLINNDPRLGEKSKKIAELTRNRVYLSFFSFFEITIKAALGKLSFDQQVMMDLDAMEIVLLPGDLQSLKEYRVFDKKNKDPFDNFLIATAKVHGFDLLSSDQKILNCNVNGLKTLDARL